MCTDKERILTDSSEVAGSRDGLPPTEGRGQNGGKTMVKHIILWQLKEEYSEEQKKEIRQGAKEGLEGLLGVVPGLLEVHVQTEMLPSSNADIMLDSTLTDAEALKNYAVHPEHVKVADTKVRPFTRSRTCIDYEV